MNLHKTVALLVEAQNNYDSKAYAECFSETAIVHDEGKTHTGRAAIQQWIAKANHEYKSVMELKDYEETDGQAVLTAKVSGTFPGSPILMKYHIGLQDGLIGSLRITG